ncbi:hypothetical protein BHF28_23960, partial [Escherichia coli]
QVKLADQPAHVCVALMKLLQIAVAGLLLAPLCLLAQTTKPAVRRPAAPAARPAASAARPATSAAAPAAEQ